MLVTDLGINLYYQQDMVLSVLGAKALVCLARTMLPTRP